MWIWIVLAIVLVFVVAIGVLWMRGRARRGKMTSLVLFFKEPRAIDAQVVRRAATKAFGVRVGSTTEEENFVVQMSPEMMPVRINNLPLGFIYSPKKYSEQDPAGMEGLDGRIVKMLTEHNAWCSIDLIADAPEEAKPAVYWHIGKLLAEFVDDNCLGIYCPEHDKMMHYTPALKDTLRSKNPLAALEMTESPVVQASYDDPALKATVTEAQASWPQFAAAFAQRTGDQAFGVKLQFDEGEESEYMWVVVDAIEGEVIRGKLDNAPMSLKNIKSGDVVTAKRADVLDWMYDENGEMRGAFSLKVLSGK